MRYIYRKYAVLYSVLYFHIIYVYTYIEGNQAWHSEPPFFFKKTFIYISRFAGFIADFRADSRDPGRSVQLVFHGPYGGAPAWLDSPGWGWIHEDGSDSWPWQTLKCQTHGGFGTTKILVMTIHLYCLIPPLKWVIFHNSWYFSTRWAPDQLRYKWSFFFGPL